MTCLIHLHIRIYYYCVDLDISTRMVHFLVVSALSSGIFGQIQIRIVIGLNSACFCDFLGVSLGDENKTKKKGRNLDHVPRYCGTKVYKNTITGSQLH